MKIIIETNIPAIIVDVWDGHHKLVIANLRGPVNVLAVGTHFNGGSKKANLEFELPQGLFALRICLPYISFEKEFPMPVVMDHHLTVRNGDEPQVLSFCANLEVLKPII